MSSLYNESMRLLSDALLILFELQRAGYEAALVGGAVRDLVLAEHDPTHQLPKDIDITTSAKPEEIQALFPESFYENEFGTVAISPHHLWDQYGLTPPGPELVQQPKKSDRRIIDLARATKIHHSLIQALPKEIDSTHLEVALPNYEITTYRSGEQYTTGYRRPDSLTWGSSLSEDLVRRDFTINALAISISQEWLENEHSKLQAYQYREIPESAYTLIDEHGGTDDLTAGYIRAVGDPAKRFEEDALRMLRAIRFSVQLNCEIDPDTFSAIQLHSNLISHVSWERIRDEWLKMLSSNYPAEALELLDDTGLLQYILPELIEGKGVQQGGHHTTDVWTHSLDALRECPSPDPIVRFATLLHDIAKPRTQNILPNTITFYNHEVVGAHLAKRIAQRFKLSKHEIDKIFILVRNHMFYYQPQNTDASIRRFMRQVGLANIDDILDLREADRLGSNARRTSWRLEEMKERMISQLHQPMDATDLVVNGTDLMKELGMKPSKELGELLGYLLEQVLENPELNTTEQLYRIAKEWMKKHL